MAQMPIGDVPAKLGLLTDGLKRGLGLALKGWLQETIQRAFETESTPEGQKWPPLSPKYAARKAGGGRHLHAILAKGGKLTGGNVTLDTRKILYLSGDLFRGFAGAQAPGIVMDVSTPNLVRVTAASALPYAAVHQYGGRAGRGLRALIPQRSYLPTQQLAEREGARIVGEVMQAIASEAGL